MNTQTTRSRRWLPGVIGVVLMAAGAASALAGLLVHGHWWGLAWAWAAGVTAAWALPRRWWGSSAFVFGWVVVLAGALFPRPEGDYLVAGTWQGYLMLASGPVLLLVAVLGNADSSPSLRRREAARLDRPS